jgi:ribonuclease D
MKAHPELIVSAADIARLAEQLQKSKIIAFDTEFIRETTFYPVIEIIQIATDDESWLVDARSFKERAKQEPEAFCPLLTVFQDKRILKVVHAAQGDQECLFTSFGIVASPTFDTAVAGSLCGYGDGVGLSNLLKAALGVSIKKGHARTNWSVRPLPQQLVDYAHVDVAYLVALAQKLMKELDELGRKQWALEISAKSEDVSIYQPDSEDVAQRLARGRRLDKRSYAALIELVRWREDRVRQLNLPRRWVADDHVLLDIAHVRPKDIAHLSAFRGLNKGELKASGEAILAALRRASEAQEVVLPKAPKPDIPTESECQVLDLLRCYVGILADRHKIALKHLVTTTQLLPLLRSKAKTVEDLIQQDLLSEGAVRLIGREVIAFLKGECALSVVSLGGSFGVNVVELEQKQS